MVHGDRALDGMGTTLTAFLFAGSRLGMIHIGDSRAYLLRDGVLTQITHDHTLVQALVDEGRISEEEASTHPQRSLITRALDGRDGIEPDLSVREVRPGDRYLLCTDGLTGPVGRVETLQEALEIPEPQESCDRLVQLALRGGGPDNVTVIVADVVDANGLRSTPAVVAGAAADSPQPPPAGIAESSAARARAAEGRDVPPPAEVTSAPAPAEPAVRRGRHRRSALVGLLAVGLLVAAAVGGWAYVRSQYYVGVDGDAVAIFRGVTGSVAGVELAEVAERTDMTTERLDRLALSRVERGIVAADRPDAEQIVARLAGDYPECTPADEVPSTLPTPVPSPLPTGAPGATAEPSPTGEAVPSALAPLCPAGAS
jgi:protein phosphatase